MYKYLYEGVFGEAVDFHDAAYKHGLILPEGVDPKRHFVVRAWVWNSEDDDYSIEKIGGPCHQSFAEYVDAWTYYEAQDMASGCLENEEEVRLELVHIHNNVESVLKSRILFGAPLAHED